MVLMESAYSYKGPSSGAKYSAQGKEKEQGLSCSEEKQQKVSKFEIILWAN